MFSNSSIRVPSAVELNPSKFYALADLTQSINQETAKILDLFLEEMAKKIESIDTEVDSLARANNALISETERTTRHKRNPFATEEEAKDPFADLRHSLDGENFLRVIFDVTQAIQRGYHIIRETAQGLRPGKLLIVGKRISDVPDTLEALQTYSIQFQMNSGVVNSFVDGVLRSERARSEIVALGRLLVDKLDRYYARLLHRHSTEGILIHGDPVVTDVAFSIYENADASGEIADGKKPDEVSAYSVRKAILVADAIKNGLVGTFIKEPDQLLKFITSNLTVLWQLANDLSKVAKPLAEKLRNQLGSAIPRARLMSDHEFEQALQFISDLDPRNVVFKEKAGLLTAEERFELEFKNETIRQVVKRLQDSGTSTDDLVQYILERKAYLHTYYQDENSFYVCKIGNGNPFTGDAPGMLTVIPGVKPVVAIDDVIGAGFDQVKEFILQIKESAKWHDLFVATSPSKSADKSNALLVGPQGCGKSEVLRAVGGDKRGVGIYAQPSDFLTCWKGEAEKNPKRLFESAVRIQKESKKQVFILIDEVDTILNDDHSRGGFGSTNLTTEFQQLMDGIVQYPHIAVWAATNHPERIPMPMIRRFSKVAIVGELDQDARIKLLQHFLGFLPIAPDFPDAAWQAFSKDLEGGVGDILRKIADEVWREKMTEFVRKSPEQAQKLVDFLNKDERFHISRFTKENRAEMHKLLSPHLLVQPADVEQSIRLHLDNVAIQAEIRTAVETYERAKMFLAGIKRNGSNGAPVQVGQQQLEEEKRV